jgi:hypothetical protein
MAALAATTPTVTGVVIAGAAVAASDTIARSVMGPKGAYLKIINGNAASDSVTISDAGLTPAGNPLVGTAITKVVTNGTSQVFCIKPEQVDPVTNLVTITHSVTATVTYELVPVGF